MTYDDYFIHFVEWTIFGTTPSRRKNFPSNAQFVGLQAVITGSPNWHSGLAQ